MVKTAIIGLGKMGLSHCSILGAHPNVDLVAICDSSTLILDAFKKMTNVRVFSDYKKMINETQPEAIFVATPTKLHAEMCIYAMQQNIHVFCEKPFCLNIEDGKNMAKIANERNLVNQVGYHNHFIGTFRELKRLLHKENILGKLFHFSGEAYGPVVTKPKGSSWRSKTEEGGGCLFDYASHVINLIQGVIAKPNKIKGALLKSYYSTGVEDAVYALLELENGLSGTLLVNWSDETYRKMSTSITIQGEKGKIVCDATELKIYLKEERTDLGLEKGWNMRYITDYAIPVDFYLRGEEYSAQVDHFINCIEKNIPNEINTFEQGLYTDLITREIINCSKQ